MNDDNLSRNLRVRRRPSLWDYVGYVIVFAFVVLVIDVLWMNWESGNDMEKQIRREALRAASKEHRP